jgi:hypothetical protein
LEAKIHHLALRKGPKQHSQENFFIFFKKISTFEEESYEIVKICGGFG